MIPVLDHTPHIEKQTTELVVASHATNIVLGANYRSIGPQNGPTSLEHGVQGPHVVLGLVLHIFAHLSIPVISKCLPIGTVLPRGQYNAIPWQSH